MAVIMALECTVAPVEDADGSLVDFDATSYLTARFCGYHDTVRQATAALPDYGEISHGEIFATNERIDLTMRDGYRSTCYRVFRDEDHAGAYRDHVNDLWAELGIVQG